MKEGILLDFENDNLTRHAKKRVKERLTTTNAERLFTLALERGITLEQANTAALKKYLAKRTDDHVYAVVYNNTCFVISRENNKCVTTYSVPADLLHEKRLYCNGKKISSRRGKNYYKKNSAFLGDVDDEKYIKELCNKYIK